MSAALLAGLALTIPASAEASVFTSAGQLDTSSFEGTGPVLAEGTVGNGKYAWVVDRRQGGDVIRGFDQVLGGSPTASIGGFDTVVAIGFEPVTNKLFVADSGLDRIFVYQRSNDGSATDPVDNSTAFSVDSFNPVTIPAARIRGLAIDPTGASIGYASIYSVTADKRVLLEFNTNTVGNSIAWIRYVWDPSLWSSTVGPGALAVNPVNGNVYVAIDGTDKIQGYTRDLQDVVPSPHSPTPGDFIALHVDHDADRLFGVKSDVIEVYSLSTARYLGTAGDDDFGTANAGFSGAVGVSGFFGAGTGTRADKLTANPAPSCDTSEPITVVSEESTTLPLACSDSDGSTIKEFSIITGPQHGSAFLEGDDGAISYTSNPDYEGADAVSFKLMTRNGPSTVFTQPIEVVPPDASPPVVTIDEPDSGLWTASSTVPIVFSVYDERDPNPSCNLVSGDDYALIPGQNEVTVSCTDANDNVGQATILVYFDDGDPIVDISSPEDGSVTNGPTAILNFSVSDALDASVSCSRVSGETLDLSPGENTITVSCEDTAGNTGSSSASIFYDDQAPQIAIDTPANGALLTDPNPDVQHTVTDNYPSAPDCTTYIIPDGFAGDSESGASELAPGTNEIFVSCRDFAGNIAQAVISVIYDAAAPDVEITDPVDGSATSIDSAVVNFSVSDDTDTQPDCTLQSGDQVSLVEGANTIAVSCTDEAGRVGSDSVSVTYTRSVSSLAEPVVRQSTNLEPKSGEVLIKLPGMDEWIPIEQAVNIPLGTVIDTRSGHAQITLANKDGSTYTSEFWGGIFQVYQLPGDNPIGLIKLRDDLAPGANATAASIPRAGVNPFRGAQIARRGKKRNGLWGSGRGRFRTTGKGGSATVRGTVWYVANYDGGTLFKVARGVVEVRPVHGNCFDLRAGQSRFVNYIPSKKPVTGTPPKKKKKKKGCQVS